jgi:heterodisulfide reductase subunit C
MPRVNPEFLRTLDEHAESPAIACMHCGTCTALCPLGLKSLPRDVMRAAVLGLEENLQAQSADIFSCLLCRLCEENCPSKVKIAEKVRALRVYLHGAGRLEKRSA